MYIFVYVFNAKSTIIYRIPRERRGRGKSTGYSNCANSWFLWWDEGGGERAGGIGGGWQGRRKRVLFVVGGGEGREISLLGWVEELGLRWWVCDL